MTTTCGGPRHHPALWPAPQLGHRWISPGTSELGNSVPTAKSWIFGHDLHIFSASTTIKPYLASRYRQYPLDVLGHDKPIWDLLQYQLSGRHRLFLPPVEGQAASQKSMGSAPER